MSLQNNSPLEGLIKFYGMFLIRFKQSVAIDNADSQRCRHDHQRENGAADSQCHPGLHKHGEGALCKKTTDAGVWSCTEKTHRRHL